MWMCGVTHSYSVWSKGAPQRGGPEELMLKHSRSIGSDTVGFYLTSSSLTDLLKGRMYGERTEPLSAPQLDRSPLPRATADAVQRVLQHLSEREEQIVRMRYGIGAPVLSVDEISDRLGVVPVQITRLEVRAFRKLREASVVGDVFEHPAPQPDPFRGDNQRPLDPADPRRLPEDPEREANPWDEV